MSQLSGESVPNGGMVTVASLIRADAITIPLADESVDLIVTSPPYFQQRDDEGIGQEPTPKHYLAALWSATAECQRVLKSAGSLWVNLGDKYIDKSLAGLPWRYAIGCVDGDAGRPWILRAEVIWSKPNGLREPHADRVRRSHEQWFHFTREKRYYGNIDPIREPYVWKRSVDPKWAQARIRTAVERGAGHRNGLSGGFTHPPHPLGRTPGSVWTVSCVPGVSRPDDPSHRHFAAFPEEFPRRIVSAWSPVRGVVLDPFCGTGTVPLVARRLGRFGIGLDLSSDHLSLAQWRLENVE